MTTREERIHTIKDFLSRPVIIHTGLWSSSIATETQLYTANFPETLISNTMLQEKLRGFVGLRANLVLKVQVNSQPFQQGRLMLQYIPYAQYMPERVSLINSTLQGRSGCPRTDLDLSVGTEIEMRIPYVSPHVYYNLITGQGSFGSIYLVVYSQLRDQVSGTGSIEYTVWAHMEDVDVQYPTGSNIFTGNAPNFAKAAARLASGRATEKDMRKMILDEAYKKGPDKIFAQVGSELKQMKESGTVSSGLGQVSEGLSTLSRIPILGNLFTRPAWISAQASNIFKMLGYSKPTVQGLPCESKLRGQTRMANFDGADTSHKMALSSANEIETKSGLAGTSADEMSFDHILSIPNYWDRFSWKTTDLTGASLWDNYVTPMKIKAYSDTISDRYRCTHTGYIANSFTYWRGSMVYTFKFVKTQFHSGRLRISFIPYYYNTTISEGVPDVSRTQKIIVDMRTATEVSFTVPYVSTRPWMYCIRPESEWLDTDNKLMYNCVTGIVRVEVLNQLVAANNVYSSIDIIAELSGGPDLTFAGPTSPSYVPYAGAFTAEATQKLARERHEEYDHQPSVVMAEGGSKIYAQVMGENEAIQRNDAQHGQAPQAIDCHSINSNWSPEAYCIGEKIMSVRQLIKRFGLLESLVPTSLKPNFLLAPYSVRAPPTTTTSTPTFTQYEYYYYLYAFWRGSMRFKIVPSIYDPRTSTRTVPRAAVLNCLISMYTSVQDSLFNLLARFSNGNSPCIITDPFGSELSRLGNSQQIISTGVEGLVEFEVPYYNVSHISPATIYPPNQKPVDIPNILKGNIPPSLVTMSLTANDLIPAASASESVQCSIYRAPGDDFSFMYLLGVPPLVNVFRSP